MPPNLRRGVGGIGRAALLAGLGIDVDDRRRCAAASSRGRHASSSENCRTDSRSSPRAISRRSASAIGSAIRMAALATTMSTRPNSCTARSNSAFTSASCVTSIFTPRRGGRLSLAMSAAVACAAFSFMSAMTHVASLPGQPLGNRLAESLRAAGDDGDFVRQSGSSCARRILFNGFLGVFVPVTVVERGDAGCSLPVRSAASASDRGKMDRR